MDIEHAGGGRGKGYNNPRDLFEPKSYEANKMRLTLKQIKCVCRILRSM